jgi:hypothetical protein
MGTLEQIMIRYQQPKSPTMEEESIDRFKQFIIDQIRNLPVAPPRMINSAPTFEALHDKIDTLLSVPAVVENFSKERLYMAILSEYKKMLQYYEDLFFLWKLPERSDTEFPQDHHDMFEHLNKWFEFLRRRFGVLRQCTNCSGR